MKLIDVMRGAVAEVEDYARVTVSTQSRAALAGSAVTDVIHLLAELIENATTLSPPFTQVRVGGETVANGFAIEIEDRGLGMTPQRLQELNERLANPPDINPANTEQLGLFVVGQLARRHGIRVMLRPSPYGGTTAVVLIPLALIVEEGPAAITSGGRAAAAGTAGLDGYRNGYRRLPGGPADGRAPWPGSGARPAGTGERLARACGQGSSGLGWRRGAGSSGAGPFGTGLARLLIRLRRRRPGPCAVVLPSPGSPGSGGDEAGLTGQAPADSPRSRRLGNPLARQRLRHGERTGPPRGATGPAGGADGTTRTTSRS